LLVFDASRKYKSMFFKSLHSTIHVDAHKCNLRFGKQKSQLLLRWADRSAYIQRPASDFGSSRGKRAFSQSDCSPMHAMVTLLYRIYRINKGYNTLIWRTWVTAASSNVVFKIAVKPLQKKWLLLTAYRKSTSPGRPI